jgi:hypothetical protein
MLDKVELATPRMVQYARAFIPALEQSMSREWFSRIWRLPAGGPYGRVGNFEPLGLPLMLHQQPRWNDKGGDKIEFFESGNMRVSEMVGLVREVYDFDVSYAEITRLDLTADMKRVSVEWFRRHLTAMRKRTSRQYISKDGAETVLDGKKPNQLRAYNKTLHREQELLPAINRKRMRDGLPKLTFREAFGYDPQQVVTRVERQMGAREPGKVFGIEYFGQINGVANVDPFSNLKFPPCKDDSLPLEGEDLMAVLYLKHFMEEHGDGLKQAKDRLRNCFGRQAFSDRERAAARRRRTRKWKLYEPFLQQTDQAYLVTKEMLLDEYKASTMVQLAA